MPSASNFAWTRLMNANNQRYKPPLQHCFPLTALGSDLHREKSNSKATRHSDVTDGKLITDN